MGLLLLERLSERRIRPRCHREIAAL